MQKNNIYRCVAVGALLCILPVFGAQITVSSYTIGTATEVSYPDGIRTKLIDGVLGTTDLIGNPGPWVGWLNANSILLTFHFASPEIVNSVQIGFLNFVPNFFTFLPDSVTIGGQTFAVGPSATPATSRNFIEFDLSPVTTQSLQIEIDRAGIGFNELVDEVEFFGTAPASGPVTTPEPAAAVISGLGLGFCGLLRLRCRRSATIRHE